ncbi:unnamed protein product [Phytophthora lilii]|uniref:Unnamed protein product n=1 Tax=Phytophthora lilii TaxID=2077276 RepID=A0A9W6U2H8_9STRA|nr:unnamed protein product [Phytophthora lilii]
MHRSNNFLANGGNNQTCNVDRARQLAPCQMTGFELDPADSSSGSDDESDEPSSPDTKTGRQARIKDSLDLSMSVLTMEDIMELSPPPASRKTQFIKPPNARSSVVRSRVTTVTKLSAKSTIEIPNASMTQVSVIPEASTTDEEQQLLQSLEKLDHRLANVSASPPPAVREGGLLLATEPTSEESSSSNAKANEDMTQAARPRSQLRHPPLASVRMSSARLADVSRARTRAGGAFIHTSSSNGIGGNSKHKVVVKKDLAHLLF